MVGWKLYICGRLLAMPHGSICALSVHTYLHMRCRFMFVAGDVLRRQLQSLLELRQRGRRYTSPVFSFTSIYLLSYFLSFIVWMCVHVMYKFKCILVYNTKFSSFTSSWNMSITLKTTLIHPYSKPLENRENYTKPHIFYVCYIMCVWFCKTKWPIFKGVKLGNWIKFSEELESITGFLFHFLPCVWSHPLDTFFEFLKPQEWSTRL